MNGDSNAAIQVASLSRRFGGSWALRDVSLCVPRGCVLGLVGENGAGKTTLIKHFLGLLKPTLGTVRVLGRDPAADPEGVLGQIGYLSEEDMLPGWMRVAELLRYLRGFYPRWDDDYAESLRRDFGVDRSAKIRSLSKGQRARVGLIAALAHRPELLILDEPSSGLDPLVRRDILAAIIRTVADDGRTVLFSSHLLGEVEQVCDRVAMIRRGELVFSEELETVKNAYGWITLRCPGSRSQPPTLAGALAWSSSGNEWSALVQGLPGTVEAETALQGATLVDRRWATLDEIFMGLSSEAKRK